MKTDKRLSLIYVDWQEKLDNNEWYFSDAFDAIVKNMSSEEAFAYIPIVVSQLLKLIDEFLIWETIYFFMQIYGKANTTEVHPALGNKWEDLQKHISSYPNVYNGPFQELKRDLRLS